MSEIASSGVSPEKYAEALSQLQAARSEIQTLTSQLADVGKAHEAELKKVQKQAADAAKAAEATAADVERYKGTALAAFRSQHLQGLHNPDAVVLPSVELNESGTGLSESSLATLTEWREANAWAFKPAEEPKQEQPKGGGNTPLSVSNSRGAAPVTAEGLAALQSAGIQPTAIGKIPPAALAAAGIGGAQ